MNTTNNKPIITLRDRGLKASVWRDHDKQGKPYYPVTLTPTYTHDQGNYHDTDRLLARAEEALDAAKNAGPAQAFLHDGDQVVALNADQKPHLVASDL